MPWYAAWSLSCWWLILCFGSNIKQRLGGGGMDGFQPFVVDAFPTTDLPCSIKYNHRWTNHMRIGSRKSSVLFILNAKSDVNEYRKDNFRETTTKLSTATTKSAKMGLYVHVPYCRRRCFYCNFAIVPIGSKVHTEDDTLAEDHQNEKATRGFLDMDQSYRASILQEISLLSSQNQQQQEPTELQSIYFGGGTPSLAPLETIRAILDALLHTNNSTKMNHDGNSKPLFTLVEDAEITMEMDPGTFSLEKLQALKDMGINRISLGVQSFDDKILKSIGRVHRYQDVLNAISMLQQVFGSNVNYSIDLISGLPELSLALWVESLATAVSLQPRPTHISLYDLQIEEGTVFGKWYYRNVEDINNNENNTLKSKISPSKNTRGSSPVSSTATTGARMLLPLEEDCAFMYKYASGYLRAKGYEHYEVSSYAYLGSDGEQKKKNGKNYRSRHNQIYWDTDGQWFGR